jgi:hypothetical protein
MAILLHVSPKGGPPRLPAKAIFSWIPSVMCTIKQLLFRIRHCSEGNDNPCREL